jgi:hypothetical protein
MLNNRTTKCSNKYKNKDYHHKWWAWDVLYTKHYETRWERWVKIYIIIINLEIWKGSIPTI